MQRALADLQATLLIVSRDLDPGTDWNQLLRHLAEGTSRQTTIDLGTVRLKHANLALRTGIPLARRRDILFGMYHDVIIVRIVQERPQGNTRRIRSARRQFGAQSSRCVGSSDRAPIDTTRHQFQAIFTAESRLVDSGLARSQLQKTGRRAQSLCRTRSSRTHRHT